MNVRTAVMLNRAPPLVHEFFHTPLIYFNDYM